MSMTIRAPRIGEGVEELTVGNWLVSEGQTVAVDDALLEVESDKVVTEVRSPMAGTLLSVLVRAGETVGVGTPLGVIGAAGEAPATGGRGGPAWREDPARREAAGNPGEASSAATAESDVASPAVPPRRARGSNFSGGDSERGVNSVEAFPKRFLSPLARRLSTIHGVDPVRVAGTGSGGRVTKRDILAYLAARDGIASGRASGTAEALASGGAAIPSPPSAAPMGAGVPGGDEGKIVPHTLTRLRIAERMMDSLRSSAQVLTVMEADLGAIVAHRAATKDAFAAEGIRLTYTAYFIAAAAAALRDHPAVNASWTRKGLVLHPTVDVGLAVSLGEEGLLAPVIREADTLSLRGLALAVADLSARARNGGLEPKDLRGGTFTVTNHGTGGSLFATPILVQDQVGILGVGALKKRPVAVETPAGDALAIKPMVYLSFVFDHRAMDGSGADDFLASVIGNLERWR